MKTTKIFLPLFLIALLACNGSIQSQTSSEKVKEGTAEALAVKKYLNSTTTLETTLLSYGNFSEVFSAEVIDAEIQQQFINDDGVVTLPISSAFFLRIKGEIFPFQDMDNLIASKELISSIKKGVTLKTEADAIAIYQALNVLDPSGARRSYGYINEGNTWFFIRNEFFEEYNGYVFSTSSDGFITSVLPHTVKKLETEKVVNPDVYFREETGHPLSLSDSETELIRNYIESSSNVSFEVDTAETPKLNALIASIFAYSIVHTYEQDGFSGSDSHGGMFVLEHNGTMQHIESIREIPCSKLFKQAVNAQITLSTNDDAQLFEGLLDEVSPAGEEELKLFYKEGDTWFFVRDTFFDDKSGYAVKIDENGKIADITYKLKLKK